MLFNFAFSHKEITSLGIQSPPSNKGSILARLYGMFLCFYGMPVSEASIAHFILWLFDHKSISLITDKDAASLVMINIYDFQKMGERYDFQPLRI